VKEICEQMKGTTWNSTVTRKRSGSGTNETQLKY